MKDDIQQITTKFPLMFGEIPSITCGDGWYDIVHCLCHTIQNHIDSRQKQHDWMVSRGDIPTVTLVPQVHVLQIKEKFGTLRFYYSGGDDYIAGAIQLSENLSSRTCENCGARGEIRNGIWIRTLCEDCYQND
jgi:hypothetical protein